MSSLDVTDRVVELFLELSNKLMRDHGVPPETLARVAVGAAVHMFMEFHGDSAHAAAAYLRKSADDLDALCTPQPPSSLN
jgi:hypothetical protein